MLARAEPAMSTDGALRIAVIGADPGSTLCTRIASEAPDCRVCAFGDGDPDCVLLIGPEGEAPGSVPLRTSVPVVTVGAAHASATTSLPVDASAPIIAAVVRGLAHHHRMLAVELGLAEQVQRQATAQIHELHEEMMLAAGLQREFITREAPSLEGLELGLMLRPNSFVSGDIYCVQRLDETKVAVLLSDAVGHGLSAGLLTMFLCSRFAHAVHDGASNPGEILAGMNSALVSCPGRPKLATAACAVIDECSGELKLASAGHPHAVLVRGTGAAPMRAEGVLLGVCENAVYETERVRMEPGDTFVVFTDGMDVLCPQHAAGSSCGALTEWLAGVFAPGRGMPEAIRAAESHLDSLAGSLRFPDDITLAAARYVGTAARPHRG
jgi:hypothetical protein